MTVGVLRIELAIGQAHSLKEKRRVIKSIKDRMSSKFNVSVAEVEAQDAWQRAVLAVALVANDARFVHQSLDRIVEWIRRQRDASLIDYERALY